MVRSFRDAIAECSSDAGRAGAQLDDELRFHLERQIAENLAAGMSPNEARYAAMRTFGNPSLLREQARATWSWTWLESLWHDVRYSLRARCCRTPGFAAIAILVIALGIGANVALFTVVRSVLLKPLPYRDPDRLVTLYETESQPQGPQCLHAGGRGQLQGVAAGRAGQGGDGAGFAVSGLQRVRRREASFRRKSMLHGVRGNFFSVLGVQPGARAQHYRRKTTGPAHRRSSCSSYSFWKRRYSGDPAIVGKTHLAECQAVHGNRRICRSLSCSAVLSGETTYRSGRRWSTKRRPR